MIHLLPYTPKIEIYEGKCSLLKELSIGARSKTCAYSSQRINLKEICFRCIYLCSSIFVTAEVMLSEFFSRLTSNRRYSLYLNTCFFVIREVTPGDILVF